MAPVTLQHQSASTFLSSRSSVLTKFPAKEFLSNTPRIAISRRRTLPVGAIVANNLVPKGFDNQAGSANENAKKTAQKLTMGDHQLENLPYIQYLNEGKIVNCTSEKDVKSTIYAIFDVEETLQYIGVSQSEVYPRMKCHFARLPSKCFYVKIKHLDKDCPTPTKDIRAKWIREWIAKNGVSPPGNDDGTQQKIWQSSALDCKLWMTEEENQKSLKEVLKKRNCTEVMLLDEKQKDSGLLHFLSSK